MLLSIKIILYSILCFQIFTTTVTSPTGLGADTCTKPKKQI